MGAWLGRMHGCMGVGGCMAAWVVSWMHACYDLRLE